MQQAHPRLSVVLCAAASLVLVTAVGAGAAWQAAPPTNRSQSRPAETQHASAGPYAAVLHPSEEASTLLSRANDGIERQDWKLAIDSLQRIIELPGEHVLTADGQLYESARRHAQRALAQLPEAGRQAYRLVHDGEAAALFEQAKREHDLDLCRTVADRFLLSGVGDEAAVTLADWLMDEGRFSEAASVLQWLRTVYPDSDLPTWVVPSRWAICLARLGQPERAAERLAEAATAQPDAADPSRRDERVRQLRVLLDKAQPARAAQRAAGWPIAMGTAARSGPMPAVEPAFPPELPWHMALPITPPREGLGRLQRFAVRQKLLPAALPVTDGRLVLFKAADQLLALDSETFEIVWQSETPATEVAQVPPQLIQQGVVLGPGGWVVQGGNDPDAVLARHSLVTQVYGDSVGGGVALAFGSALTIEWPVRLPDPIPLWNPNGQPMLQRGYYAPAGLVPNRLAAYAMADGKLLWSTENSPDLAGAQFLAVPVVLGDHLVAPCRLGSDLYAIVLDPQTGGLVRHIYLCGIGSELFDPLYALSPCVVDGVVYFPTGRGVLVAMEASDFSIRWVSRYDQAAGKTIGDSWLPTPAMAVADVVLLAPQDADFLLCIDRASGRIRWMVPRANAQYVIAATDQRVWLGGETVVAADIETGRPVWTQPCAEASGRGILAGDRLYLPTVSGLVAMDAGSGRAIDVPPQGEREPLGNLLAWDGALYSLAAFDVHKYPDLGQGYRDALARHGAEPADGSAAIRLAWLELLRGKPDAALVVLGAVPPAFEAHSPQRYSHLVHLKVTAMLDLASGPDLAPARALELLEQARAIARSPGDAIHTAVALGDHYHRNRRVLDACRQYLSLVLSAAGDEMLNQGEGYESRARMLAARRLAKALGDLSEGDQRVFLAEIRTRFRRESEEEEQAFLGWAMESEELGQPSCEAAVLLGAWAASEYRFEQAERCFARAMHHPASPPGVKAEAIARLAGLYLQPEDLHQPAAAVALLDRLAGEFASVPLPADLLLDPSAERAVAPVGEDRKTLPAAQLAARLRERVATEMLTRHQAALAPAVLGVPGPPQVVSPSDRVPILVRGDRSEPLVDKRLVLEGTSRVEAQAAAVLAPPLWEADLRLLHELSVESEQESQQERRMDLLLRSGRRNRSRVRGVIEGQTLVMSSPVGLYALGTLTGRRLWSRPFDPPLTAARESAFSDAWVWLHQGYVISADARGRLEVCRADAGDRVLWQRTNNRQSWYWVRARGEYVVAMEAGLEHVDIFALSDGRTIGSCSFVQGDDRVSIMLFDGVICGPAQAQDVAAFNLATPGVERWRLAGTDRIAQLFKPAPDLLAVADQSGQLSLVDPLSGKVCWQTRVEACAEGVLDGVVQGGILYVCGMQRRATGGARLGIERQRWGVAALRMADGSVIWQQGELPARTHLSAEVLKASANAIPIASIVAAEPSPARAGGQVSDHDQDVVAVESRLGVMVPRLLLLDKATGRAIGQPVVPTQPAGVAGRSILDVQVWPDRVDVLLESTWLQFPCPR
ncbi:MAG: PQQ-binding-like beta-propeller repeat protein [Phycisphaerae bacterium]|nr:PQQ-binding-like beta-propeller repeat protein [Phycisphaerae bacterium]